MSQAPLAKLENVSFSYPKGSRVLSAGNLVLNQGEWVAIRGEVGSGKTTLLRIFSTLLKPQQGTVLVPSGFRDQLAWVSPSDQGLLPHLTGLENIHFFNRKRTVGDLEKLIAEWSVVLPLDKSLGVLMSNCSSGMKRSLVLFMAIVNDPEVFVLDEPTRSLDPEARARFWNKMKEIAGGKSILFSSHDPAELQVADRIYVCKDGVLSEEA